MEDNKQMSQKLQLDPQTSNNGNANDLRLPRPLQMSI